jgi:hypothetical protein
VSVQHAPPNYRALDNAVQVFASAEILWKFQQLGCCAVFFGASGRAAAMVAVISAPAWCWIVAAVLIGVGQTLNVAMYSAIGNAGVYYGFKMGHDVPWAYGFPFNVGLRHPQYVGVVLSISGASTLTPATCIASYVLLLSLHHCVARHSANLADSNGRLLCHAQR